MSYIVGCSYDREGTRIYLRSAWRCVCMYWVVQILSLYLPPLFTPPPPPATPVTFHLCNLCVCECVYVSVCVCVCVCVCVQGIQYFDHIIHYFWGLNVCIIAVCSPLSVRYSAVEMTAIIIIIIMTERKPEAVQGLHGAGGWCLALRCHLPHCHADPQNYLADLPVLLLLHQAGCHTHQVCPSGKTASSGCHIHQVHPSSRIVRVSH